MVGYVLAVWNDTRTQRVFLSRTLASLLGLDARARKPAGSVCRASPWNYLSFRCTSSSFTRDWANDDGAAWWESSAEARENALPVVREAIQAPLADIAFLGQDLQLVRLNARDLFEDRAWGQPTGLDAGFLRRFLAPIAERVVAAAHRIRADGERQLPFLSRPLNR